MPQTIEQNLAKCHIGIISKGRPKNILNPIYDTIHAHSTWYVPDLEEVQNYFESVFELKIKGKPFPRVIVGGKLVESRNKIIDDAVQYGKKYAVIIEDDLTKLHNAIDKKTKEVLDITQAIEMMIAELEKQEFAKAPQAMMIGVAPTPNSFYYNPDKPISVNKFCVGSFLVINAATPLRFDRQMKLKEDYDYTLQHIAWHGIVLRADYILASFKHYSNKGGVVGYRNNIREAINIKYLKDKWGSHVIKDNPRRQNEILISPKFIKALSR